MTLSKSQFRCFQTKLMLAALPDEAGAQQALDASGLNRLSSDGAVLLRAGANQFGIGPLDLPRWTGQDFGARKTSQRICPCSRTTRGRIGN